MALTTIEKALQDFVVRTSGLADTHVIIADGKPRPVGTYIALVLDSDFAPASDDDKTEHNPLVFENISATGVDADTFLIETHPLVNADGPIELDTSGVLPAPLLVGTPYWIITTVDGVKLAATRTDARHGNAITLLDEGTGTHSILCTEDTRRAGEEIRLVKQGQRLCTMQLQCFAVAPTGAGSARAILKRVVDRSELPGSVAILDAAGIGGVGFDAVQYAPEIKSRDVFEGRAFTSFTYFVVAREYETETTIEAVEITNPRGRTRVIRRV